MGGGLDEIIKELFTIAAALKDFGSCQWQYQPREK